MNTPLEIITSYNVPTSSYIRAIQTLNDADCPILFSKEQYEKNIAEIIGAEIAPTFSSEKEARIYFLYTVQETIRAFNFSASIPDMESVWKNIQLRASKLIQEQPWLVKDYSADTDGEPKVDAAGNPVRRKGAKKEECEILYQQLNDGVNTRVDIIASLMEEVGMTKPGATTYFHNMKKKFGFSGPAPIKTKRKRDATPPKESKHVPSKVKKISKSKIAEQVFKEMIGCDKNEVLDEIVKRANTSRAGANTYYCACKKNNPQ